MSYAREKFNLAIRSLAVPGLQRERLVNAYVYNIIHVKPEAVPADIRDELRQFQHDITRVDAKGGEGKVQATVNAMDDAEVNGMIERVISMHDAIARYEERSE